MIALKHEAGGLLLSYASYRWEQAWRSLWVALTHPGGHRPPAPLAADALCHTP